MNWNAPAGKMVFVSTSTQKTLCTDNAAMIGILAERKLLKGEILSGLDAEAQPGWALA